MAKPEYQTDIGLLRRAKEKGVMKPQTSENNDSFWREKEALNQMCDAMGKLIERIKLDISRVPRKGTDPGVTANFIDRIRLEQGKLESLKMELKRKKMKVSIFGATSSGKSTVVNAMIGIDLMSSGMGHTTSCFVQIEESRKSGNTAVDHDRSCRGLSTFLDGHSYYAIRKPNARGDETVLACCAMIDEVVPLEIEEFHELTDATADNCLHDSYLIEVYLSANAHECPLLRHHLQILDCPGISSCSRLGDRVKSFCGDSDVHVLIVDSCSVMTPEEKEHFLKVKEKIPSPDIVIGFTKWDLSANERNADRVKQQHLSSAYELLKATNTVTTPGQVHERSFFISGSEALSQILGENRTETKGFKERKHAFDRFISKIEERASVVGKKVKLDNNRKSCEEILNSCVAVIDEMRKWSLRKRTQYGNEADIVKRSSRKLKESKEQFQEACRMRRQEAQKTIDEEVTDVMEGVIRKMRENLSKSSGQFTAFERDGVQEYAKIVIHDWYTKVHRGFLRATRMVSEDYSFNVLEDYKKHFSEFPHEHPRAYLQVLNEEIVPGGAPSELQQEVLTNLLSGIKSRGHWAFFAATQKHLTEVESNDTRSKVVRRLATGASVVSLRIRRWLKDSVDSKVLRRVETEQQEIYVGLEDLKESCRLAIVEFCDTADAYYQNALDNSLKGHSRAELLKIGEKSNHLEELEGSMAKLRSEAEQIKKKT